MYQKCGYYIKNQETDSNKFETGRQELNYSTCGMLLFDKNRIQPESYQEFTDIIDNQINALINRIELLNPDDANLPDSSV